MDFHSIFPLAENVTLEVYRDTRWVNHGREEMVTEASNIVVRDADKNVITTTKLDKSVVYDTVIKLKNIALIYYIDEKKKEIKTFPAGLRYFSGADFHKPRGTGWPLREFDGFYQTREEAEKALVALLLKKVEEAAQRLQETKDFMAEKLEAQVENWEELVAQERCKASVVGEAASKQNADRLPD